MIFRALKTASQMRREDTTWRENYQSIKEKTCSSRASVKSPALLSKKAPSPPIALTLFATNSYQISYRVWLQNAEGNCGIGELSITPKRRMMGNERETIDRPNDESRLRGITQEPFVAYSLHSPTICMRECKWATWVSERITCAFKHFSTIAQ